MLRKIESDLRGGLSNMFVEKYRNNKADEYNKSNENVSRHLTTLKTSQENV